MNDKLKIILCATAVLFLTGVGAVAGKYLIPRNNQPPAAFPQAPALSGIDLPVLDSEAIESDSDHTLPLLLGKSISALLKNPDRGLRMETYITLGEVLESYPGNAEDPYEKLLNFIEKYEEDSPTVVQLYVYLTRYNEKPLDDIAFGQLKRMFELCRDQKVRALLRFAYQNESNPDPSAEQVMEHLDQLGEWIKANGKLFEEAVFAVQAGIVGYWGEGHSNVNIKRRDIGRIFDRLCSIIPEDVFVQVRNVDLESRVSLPYKPRLGMHDDYIIGEMNGSWSYFNGRKIRGLEEQFKRTVNDAEMPWGVAKYYDREDGGPMDSLDATGVLKQIRQYALTTFSLEHNYREAGPDRIFSMQRWKDVYVTPAQLDELEMPYLPGLFDKDGKMSAYDYIRYHLGYLLSITSFELNLQHGTMRFTIQNNGFAAPLNFNALSVVINGKEYLADSYDKYALLSGKAVTYTVDLPGEYDSDHLKSISIKLAHCAGSDISVRFANDTDFVDGAQIQWTVES